MSDIAVRVENLGKRYRIDRARQRHDTLRDALTAGLRAPLGWLRTDGHRRPPAGEDTIWALKDVSFEVRRGEVVGIIGANGAGKSTLLKILSRITPPTEGQAEIHGRVGSLLEVGTGFHPELSGRENVYLSGAVLGMRRAEIDRLFDQIVAFAEVERFIDTPIKRYSSGMKVRLGFAVAAHLQPEVLLVDEVLAVGDAAFQRKCVGKMGDVAREGRTVLFVSHNMAAIRALCSRAILIDCGRLAKDADSETVVKYYLDEGNPSSAWVVWDAQDAPQSPEVRFAEAYVLDDKGAHTTAVDCQHGFSLVLEYEVRKPTPGLRIGFEVQNLVGVIVSGSTDWGTWPQPTRDPGYYASKCVFPGYTLNAGAYRVYFGADVLPDSERIVTTDFCLGFNVEDVEGHGPYYQKLPGILRPNLQWSVDCKANR